MKKNKTLFSGVQLILVSAFHILCFHESGYSQHTRIIKDFYLTEGNSWLEYISRVQYSSTSSSFDVQFYYLNLEIGVSTQFISGNVTCRFNITANNVSFIDLQLHHALNVTSVSGNVHSYFVNNDSIHIQLDDFYQVGETGEINVVYEGIPELADNIKGLNYTMHGPNEPLIVSLSTPFLAHYWWPCKDGPGDKADSVYIDITIPDTTINGIPLVAVSNGLLENITTSAGKKTFHWRHRYPIVPYYVMVAVSNYRNFRQNYINPYGENFSLDYYVFSEHLAEAQSGVAQLPSVIDLFTSLFGPYPFEKEKYGMTQTGFYGAIENQTNTVINEMSMDWFRVSVHELAHMWFGDMITCVDWHHGWLNEGFATYCEALWTENIGGFAAYSEHMTNLEYYADGSVYLYNTTDPFNIFIDVIYRKGAYVLHMLRGLMGDSLFFKSLYWYSQDNRFRYNHAKTEDFQLICENVSGEDLDYFFDQWIYDTYYPCYEYGYIQNPVTHEVTMKIKQTQVNRGWRPVFKMPIQLQFFSLFGEDSLITILNDSTSQHYRFKFSTHITRIEFDPYHWILKEAVYSPDILQQIPYEVILSQNFPNPFNSTTTIQFNLPTSASVTLNIFDLQGKKVVTLLSFKEIGEGLHYVSWNGRNDSGIFVSTGVYFYQLITSETCETKKMIFLK